MAQSKGLQGTCRKLVGWLVAVLSNQTQSPKEEPLILRIRRGAGNRFLTLKIQIGSGGFLAHES